MSIDKNLGYDPGQLDEQLTDLQRALIEHDEDMARLDRNTTVASVKVCHTAAVVSSQPARAAAEEIATFLFGEYPDNDMNRDGATERITELISKHFPAAAAPVGPKTSVGGEGYHEPPTITHAFYRHEFGECCSWPADMHTAGAFMDNNKGVWFKSAASSLWYENYKAAGTIAAVKVDGVWFPAAPVAATGDDEGEIHGAFNKHLAQRHEELATAMRETCTKVLDLIEQYTRPDFYMWLLYDHAGQQSDPYKRAAEAKKLLTELLNSKPSNHATAALRTSVEGESK